MIEPIEEEFVEEDFVEEKVQCSECEKLEFSHQNQHCEACGAFFCTFHAVAQLTGNRECFSCRYIEPLQGEGNDLGRF